MKQIRLWKLGSLEHMIFPSKQSIQRLNEILTKQIESGQSVFDIIWGPELTLEVYNVEEVGTDYIVIPDIHKFKGPEEDNSNL